MSNRMITDDEVLYRRIPPGNNWFEPPDRITSFNFKLRPDELGLSVYRKSEVDVAGVLSKPGTISGSRVAQATASQILAAQNGKGEPLHLDVVVVNDEDDPGHSEIRGPVPGVIPNSAANALRKLFRLVDPPS